MPETLSPEERARFLRGVILFVVFGLLVVGTCVFGCLIPAAERARLEKSLD